MTRPSSQLPRPGPVVAAAADRDQQALLAPEVHGRDDVGDVGAARDEPRALVDHAVVELARLVVAGSPGWMSVAAEGLRKAGDGIGVEHGLLLGIRRNSVWNVSVGDNSRSRVSDTI